LLIMERNGYPEETYYTFSYTPIPGDNGVTAGVFCANTDDTSRVINERALETLRRLGKISYHEKKLSEIYEKTAEVLEENKKDFQQTRHLLLLKEVMEVVIYVRRNT